MIQLQLPTLEPWQQEVFDAMISSAGSSKIYVVKAKRQIGKSVLAIVELLYFAFNTTRATTSVVLEPTLAQSRRVFKQISDLLEGTKVIKTSNASLLTMKFVNGSEIIFKSAEQKEALRGFTVNGLLVIDEAAYIPDEIFEIVFPTTDANKAPILIISTPLFEDGLFFDLYTDGLNGSSRIESFDWNKYDTSKFLSPASLEMYRKTLTGNKFRTDYLGLFITEGSYIFGNVRECIGNSQTGEGLYVGIDWAIGRGGDDTVVTVLDGEGAVVSILFMNNQTPTDQVKRIKGFLKRWENTIKTIQVELNSIGSVYYDMLTRALPDYNIKGFVTENESKRRIIEQLIKAFENRAIKIPDNPKLIMELQHYEQQKLKKGYTYNAAGGYHDDAVISLALAYDLLPAVKQGQYKVYFGNKTTTNRIWRN